MLVWKRVKTVLGLWNNRCLLIEGAKLAKEAGADECCLWGSMFALFKHTGIRSGINLRNALACSDM